MILSKSNRVPGYFGCREFAAKRAGPTPGVAAYNQGTILIDCISRRSDTTPNRKLIQSDTIPVLVPGWRQMQSLRLFPDCMLRETG